MVQDYSLFVYSFLIKYILRDILIKIKLKYNLRTRTYHVTYGGVFWFWNSQSENTACLVLFNSIIKVTVLIDYQ